MSTVQSPRTFWQGLPSKIMDSESLSLSAASGARTSSLREVEIPAAAAGSAAVGKPVLVKQLLIC